MVPMLSPFQLQLVPKRLMGKITPLDIVYKNETIVKNGERISARHIRKIESAKLKTLTYQKEDMEGLVLAKDLIDKTTGELVIACNTILDEEVLSVIHEFGLKESDIKVKTFEDSEQFYQLLLRAHPLLLGQSFSLLLEQ